MGCWAPEAAPPSPKKQPPVSSDSLDQQTQIAEEVASPHIRPNANYTKEERKELQEQARKPPYTAWTMATDVSILGPNGGSIFNISKRGTRLEVHKIVPQYAQVLCSGCAPPRQNQAGWVNIENISMEWDMPEEDPLLTMLSLRSKWLKNDDTPKELQNRRSICMIFDNGYEETKSGLLWSIQGGSILLTKAGDQWTVSEITSPTTEPAPSWRCDPPKNPSNQ